MIASYSFKTKNYWYLQKFDSTIKSTCTDTYIVKVPLCVKIRFSIKLASKNKNKQMPALLGLIQLTMPLWACPLCPHVVLSICSTELFVPVFTYIQLLQLLPVWFFLTPFSSIIAALCLASLWFLGDSSEPVSRTPGLGGTTLPSNGLVQGHDELWLCAPSGPHPPNPT